MTAPRLPSSRAVLAVVAIVSLLASGYLLWREHRFRPERLAAGRHPEQLVYVRSHDDAVNGGALFLPPKGQAKALAVVWIHGWGTNFYDPAYVAIGRALADRAYASILANTRMHDLATTQGYRMGRRVRGGGYWGVGSDQVHDVAAWIDLAEATGFPRVVLVGHSAGWAAVRQYQAERQDGRVAGLVSASGQVYPNDPPDAAKLAEATRMVAEGRGDDLLRFTDRPWPSFVSAATYLDIANTPPEIMDFYGVRAPNPAIGRIRCPLLAFFGTGDDVGGAKDLEVVKASSKHQAKDAGRVDTALIAGANHMYHGAEQQVADVIIHWMAGLEAPR